MDIMYRTDESLVQKWEPVLEGIGNEYTRRVTAQLLENQAKAVVQERMDEGITNAATTTGQLGVFQKFAFPIVRRVFPDLIANKIVGVQPMQGPVSQVFYIGSSRAKRGGLGTSDVQPIYSKYNLTYRGLAAQRIGSRPAGGAAANQGTFLNADGTQYGTASLGLDGDITSTFDVSNVLAGSGVEIVGAGAASGTFGGQIAAWPLSSTIYGWSLSAGERLDGTGIPEMTFHIEQEAVVANTRKMRALWTLEASQDLKAYHNLDLERELTDLLSKELQLEIDRELIEDLRMIAYGLRGRELGGVNQNLMDNNYVSLGSFPGIKQEGNVGAATEVFVPNQFTYDFAGQSTEKGTGPATASNVFIVDLTSTSLGLQPRHVGEVYANLLAAINLAAQDIHRTTMRGPGNWILTSPLIASMLESAAKLEGGIAREDGPTNFAANSIQFKGKFMGRYDLFIDPMFPTDEILVGYKGSNAMDAGFIYAPYIPLQQLPTITDPETFQPRKGILTRYGKVQIQPLNRFYRVIRIVGPAANYLFTPFARNTTNLGSAVGY